MYEQILSRSGLNEDQAKVYEALLKHGKLSASKISAFVGLKRGLTYKILDKLAEMKLVDKKEAPKSVAEFEPAHPLRLKDLAEEKAKEAHEAGGVLQGVLPQLISDFNLVSGKPGIQFFEGEEGVKRVLDDSLTSKTEIYSYADIEAIIKYIEKINDRYVRQREKLELKKKALLADTPFARKYLSDYHRAITDIRLIAAGEFPFQTVMQIYDNKISYITLAPERMLGIIISDSHIYEMHRQVFEYAWEKAQAL